MSASSPFLTTFMFMLKLYASIIMASCPSRSPERGNVAQDPGVPGTRAGARTRTVVAAALPGILWVD